MEQKETPVSGIEADMDIKPMATKRDSFKMIFITSIGFRVKLKRYGWPSLFNKDLAVGYAIVIGKGDILGRSTTCRLFNP